MEDGSIQEADRRRPNRLFAGGPSLWRPALAGTALALVLVTAGGFYMRPTARAKRLLRGAGLPELPVSAKAIRLERQGLGTGRAYLRFSPSIEDAEDFFARGVPDLTTEPVPMRSLHFGPRSPSWMQWGTSVDGRVVHFMRNSTSVWLAIDDRRGTIYVGVVETGPSWFHRLWRR
jgi:hypothetical protein